MKKHFIRTLSLFLSALLLLTAFPLSVSAAQIVDSGACGENVTWTLDSDGLLTISGSGAMEVYYYDDDTPWYSYRSSIKTLVIRPGVTNITSYVFYACHNLTSVTISDSVVDIGTGAFGNCTGLTSVKIPDSVYIISSEAFHDCTGLTDITIPNGVITIQDGAFSGCTRLNRVTIPDSVTTIEANTFSGCTSLSSITIPESVTTIRYGAFSSCTGLTSITIPENVTYISPSAFSRCSGLSEIYVDEGNSEYHSYHNCLIKTNSKTLIQGCNNSVIPDDGSVTSINDSAFYDCVGLTGVTIPDSVLSIGDRAFAGCTGLTGISIPDSVLSIGDSAFAGCSGLTGIMIPNSVTSIEYDVFFRCTGLASITISESVISIEDSAFWGCTGLTGVTIPASVTKIGSVAFYGCTALERVVFAGTPTVDESAFDACPNLKDVYFAAGEVDPAVSSARSAIYSRCPDVTFHYDSAVEEVRLAYCSGNTQTDFYLDGVRYTFAFPVYPTWNRYAGKEVKYRLNAEGKLTYLADVKYTDVQFEELDYANRTFRADGVTYQISDHCWDSEAIKAFIASPDMFFDGPVQIAAYQLEEGGVTKNILYSVRYTDTVKGIFRGTETNDGRNYVKLEIDGAVHSYPCMDVINADASMTDQKVTCVLVNGRASNVIVDQQSAGTKNEALRQYLEDYTEASLQVLQEVRNEASRDIKMDLENPGSTMTVETLAEQMLADQKNKKTFYITWISEPQDEKAINAAFQALAEIYIDVILQEGFDFSKVNASSNTISFSMDLLKAITSAVKTVKTEKTINGYQVSIDLSSTAGAYFGTMTVKNGERSYKGNLVSSVDATNKVLIDYYEKLGDVVRDEVAYAVSTYIWEFCDVSGIYDYLKKDIGKALNEKYAALLDKMSPQNAEKFRKIIHPKMIRLLQTDIQGILDLNDAVKRTSSVSKGDVISMYNMIRGISFDENDLGSFAGKNAVKKLKKEQQRLVRALNDYLEDTELVYKSLEEEEREGSWIRSIFKCPVDLEVYDETGRLIGWVDSNGAREESLWYEEPVEIEIAGNAKTVIYPADQTVSIKTIATADGSMNVSIVELSDGKALDRLNYYDVPLVKGCTYTQTRPANTSLAELQAALVLQGEDAAIPADEFLKETEAGRRISVGLTASPGGAAVGGGEFVKGDFVSLQALPDAGYTFAGWYRGDALVSRKPVYQFAARTDLDLTAAFEITHIHSYIETVTEDPSCTLPGERVFFCEGCGDSFTDPVLPLEHSWNAGEITTPAACKTAGEKTFTCTVCGETKTEAIPAAGEHRWDAGRVTGEPTATAEGECTFTCTVCGETKTEPIEKLAPARLPGDVNGDGKVTASDARLALRRAVGLETYAEGSPAFLACDVNRDGKVTAADARKILRAAVGLETLTSAAAH